MQSFERSKIIGKENPVYMEVHLVETKNFVILQKQIRISAQICHSIVTELTVVQ